MAINSIGGSAAGNLNALPQVSGTPTATQAATAPPGVEQAAPGGVIHGTPDNPLTQDLAAGFGSNTPPPTPPKTDPTPTPLKIGQAVLKGISAALGGKNIGEQNIRDQQRDNATNTIRNLK